jgi:adenylylsulfate kinase-like enzyme
VAITAAISPYRSIRDEIRASIENFVEIYVNTPLEICIKRDVKGMYKRAIAGELTHFTGVDDPYEPPLKPELIVETAGETPAESAARILAKLERMGLIERAPDVTGYSPEEEGRILSRLVSLGYLKS